MKRISACGLGVIFAATLSCGAHAPAAAGARSARAPQGRAARNARSRTRLIGEYAVTYDGRGELHVEAALDHAGQSFTVESGAEAFLHDFEVTPEPAAGAAPAWTRGARNDRAFVAAACAGRCRIRYRYALRVGAKKLADLDVASEEGEVIEAPPSTWLLVPEVGDNDATVRFRVASAEGSSFVTGVFRSPDVPNAWDIALGDLWTAPYSAFGPFRVLPVDVGGEPSARIDLAIAPGKLALTDEELTAWTIDSARALVSYVGHFPLPEALVLIVPGRGRWVGEGKTLSGGGGAIFMRVGDKAVVRQLKDDWVLVHEMTHLAFPSVPREHDWAEEGLATYVEPFARARVGTLTVESAWQGLIDGLPNGLPAAGDRGLDRTPTWGRTYWGGALFYLLADLEIRKATKNRLGLEHALRGILAAGGNNAHRWPLEEAFATADKAIGLSVLTDLHAAMGTSPHPVDLEALWQKLGIVRARGIVRFDDTAPLAAIRRAITAPEGAAVEPAAP